MRRLTLIPIMHLIAKSSKADFINDFVICNDETFDAHKLSDKEQDMIIAEICNALLSV